MDDVMRVYVLKNQSKGLTWFTVVIIDILPSVLMGEASWAVTLA